MEHLNAEVLARIVDSPPSPEESAHLESCLLCAAEAAAYRAQTEALGDLPEIRPPRDDWRVLEARLRSEGLVDAPGLFQRLGLAHTPPWMKAAAAIVLFLFGTGTGAMLTSGGGITSLGDVALLQPDARFANTGSVDEAANAVRIAEQNYVAAVARYQQLMYNENGIEVGVDPMSRMAALQTLVAASQAAVRQAPGDPYLNGLLASTLAEREATLRLVSSKDNWF